MTKPNEHGKPPRKLTAIVEIVDGEVLIFPVADSDRERAEILDALRIYFGENERRRGE